MAIDLALPTEMNFNLVKENKCGNAQLGTITHQESCRREQVFPDCIVTEVQLLNFPRSLKIFLHQKEPFRVWLGSLPFL
jgi:hypothetical protein